MANDEEEPPSPGRPAPPTTGAPKAPRKLGILHNASAMMFSRAASDLFTFLFFVVLSRVFGQEGIGQYSFAMALTGFFGLFGDFGLYNLSVKEISRSRSSVAEYAGRAFVLRVAFSAAAFAVLLAATPFATDDPETRGVIILLGVYQLAYRIANGLAAVFVAMENTRVVALLEISLRLSVALAGIGIALSGGSLLLAVAPLPVFALLEIVVAWVLVARVHGRPRLTATLATLVATARESASFGLSSLLFQLNSRVDVVLLGVFLGMEASGTYNVAYRVVFLLTFVAHYAGVALFPVACRLFVSSRDDLQKLYERSLEVAVLVGVPASIGLFIIAPDLIGLVFGEAFEASVPVLSLLAWLLVLSGVKNLLGIFLMACDRQPERVRNQSVTAVLNIVLNVALIPWIGILGAVIATLVAEGTLCILHFARIRTTLATPPLLARVAISVFASACFALPPLFGACLPLPLFLPAAVIVYVAVVGLSRNVRESDLRPALAWLASRLRGRALAGALGASKP